MSQAAAQQPSRKKTVISLLVLLALTCIIVFTFKDHWAEITAALAQLSVWQVLAVLAVGISYPLLEGCVAWVIVRSRLPQFKLWQGLDVGWCGTFGNVVTLGAGAVPVQLYYLHRAGLPLGPGAGLMTLEYVFHKSTVLLYATVMLLLQHRWLSVNTTGVMRYLPMAYAVVAVIIVALVLLCVSPLVQNLARWLLGFLPKTEKWQQRRADWLEQLEVLGTESRRLSGLHGHIINKSVYAHAQSARGAGRCEHFSVFNILCSEILCKVIYCFGQTDANITCKHACRSLSLPDKTRRIGFNAVKGVYKRCC
jgi:hypothetical protein